MMTQRWNLGILGAVFLTVSFGFAQTPPDQQPANPQPAPPPAVVPPNAGGPGKVIVPQLEELPESSTVESFGPSSYDDDEGSYSTSTQASSSSAPQEYVIEKGDTLWDICTKLLGNPWYWPKLWSFNKYIKNPHLIYPGNRLVFYEGSQTQMPYMGVDTGQGIEEPVTDSSESEIEGEFLQDENIAFKSVKDEVRLRPITFVAEKKIKFAGKISHSGMPKIELTYGDTVYIDFYKKTNVSVGDKFYVVEETQPLRGANKREKLGKLIRRNAILEVVKIWEKTVEARIISSDYAVRRGYQFIPYTDAVVSLKPFVSSGKDLNGHIVGAESQQFLVGNNDYVFLDRGSKKGVQPGQNFFVVKKGDGLFPGDDDHLPDVIKGKLIVVEVFRNTSTAYVVDLKEDILIGDRVRSKVE